MIRLRQIALIAPDLDPVVDQLRTTLGLAIVDALAAASGGSVSLSDSDGGGLTVRVELPLA